MIRNKKSQIFTFPPLEKYTFANFGPTLWQKLATTLLQSHVVIACQWLLVVNTPNQ